MSMQSWSEPGYGFRLFNDRGPNNFKKVAEFLRDNCSVELSADEMLDLQDAIQNEDEFCLGDIFGDSMVSWVVAKMINELEGFEFVRGYDSCGDTNQDQMIGIEPTYPWSNTDLAYQCLTREKADELLEKYAGLLGINAKPDYFDAQYFG